MCVETPLLLILLATVSTLWIACGWGPGIHIKLASRLLDGMQDTLRSDQVEFLTRYRQDFLYGNIAADLINFKKYGGIKNHCHNWNMRERIETLIDAEHEYAFLQGFLCHLAADSIAHNHFVPYHILYGLPPKLLGHTYWEAKSDDDIPEQYWKILDELRLQKKLHESDRVINKAVPKKALSMFSNKLIFNYILLARSRKSWRGVIEQMRLREPRWHLQRPFVEQCLDVALQSMIDTFDDQKLAVLRTGDPNGHLAIAEARRLRQGLIRAHRGRRLGAEPARALAEETYGFPART